MEMNNSGSQICCPVCTLFLREGMTLQDHLHTHPKDQVIDALVRISLTRSPIAAVPVGSNSQYTAITYQHFRSSTTGIPTPTEPNVTSVPLMVNPCALTPQPFLNSTPPPPPLTRNLYQSNVRSPVPLHPYSYYPPHHQNWNGNSQNQNPYSNNNIDPIQYTESNISQTTQTTNSPFNDHIEDSQQRDTNENEHIAEVQPTIDPFLDERQDIHCNPSENEEEKEEDDEIDNFIDSSHNNIGTVISDTHRLITNDPTLTYDQEIRSNVEFANVQFICGSSSPREEVVSPLSTSSNWSSGSTLRVRRDLNNHNSIINVERPISVPEEDEYITDECRFIETNDRSDGHLLNLDSVPLTRGFTVDTRLEIVKDCDNIDNKEDNSDQGVPINIHSDELMPPRGELSGQESLGATENSVWEIQDCDERSREMVPSYNMLNKEKWGIEPVHEKAITVPMDTVTIPQPQYKCANCSKTFVSLKERRIHFNSEHKINKKKTVVSESTVKREESVIPEPTSKFVEVFVKEETSGLKIELDVRTCQDCSLELPSLKELRKHRRIVHMEKKVRRKCTTCEKCFPDSTSFKNHIVKVHPLECIDCGKCFQSKANLTLHQKRHLKVRPFRCTVCDKSFVTKQKLSEHENAHSGNEPFKCNLCVRTFKRYSNLIQHRNFHHLRIKKKVKDYFCHCGEVFHTVKKLEWHKEIHEPKPKQCLYCSQKFVHSASLTRHIRHNHDNAYLPTKAQKIENVECPICHQQYLKTSLAMHMRIHSGEKPFSCTTCSKQFSTKWNLQLHKWTHASRNSKPFKCKLCKSAFISGNDYQAHMRSHRNIRPYICNHCGRQFIRKYNCMRHVREHELSKSYICQECGKSFHRSYYLTEHMRMHTGFKPFACHICGKRSSTKSNHNKHIKTHHAREPVNTEG